MSSPEPTRLPTLTEVVAHDADAPSAPDGVTGPVEPSPSDDADRLTQRMLASLEQRIDLMLEYRLRDVLGPALARASDTLIGEMRVELAAAMRDVVARAVAQELGCHRLDG
jgi:hypothetical protein